MPETENGWTSFDQAASERADFFVNSTLLRFAPRRFGRDDDLLDIADAPR
jgi:hypothetical protein